MCVAAGQPVAAIAVGQCPGPREALVSMCGGFARFDASRLVFDEVRPAEMPAWARSLLVHDRHMTRVLAEQYGRAVNLYVMEQHSDGRHYARKIFLTAGQTADAVEYGVARLDLSALPAPARREILGQRIPLGAVLMRHSAMRRIEPLWYLRLAPDSPMARWFGARPAGEMYGRIGIIHCDQRPVVEVIEIVPNPTEHEQR